MIDSKEIKSYLESIFKDFGRKPFLFVGSGMSHRYLSLPLWRELLLETARRTYEQYEEKFLIIEDKVDTMYSKEKKWGKLPKIATQISLDYNERFRLEADFEKDLKTKYPNYLKDRLNPYKLLVSDILTTTVFTDYYKHEIEGLKRIHDKISGVITTNYDTFFENLFSGFSTYVGQTEMITNELFYDGEIYKINGCINNPTSIVITDSDYEEFNEKSIYLNSQLITLLIDYPIIFLGYSIEDQNIQEILKVLSANLSKEQKKDLTKRLLFVEYTANLKNQSIGIVTEQGITMNTITLKFFGILYKALDKHISPGLPVPIIRRAKEMISDLVLNAKASNGVYLTNLNDDNLDPQSIAIMISSRDSILEKGYVGINFKDVYIEAMKEETKYDPNKLFDMSIMENKAKCARSRLPISRYLKMYVGTPPKFCHDRVINSIEDLFSETQIEKFKNFNKITTLSEIDTYKVQKQIFNVLYSLDKLSLVDIKKFISTHMNSFIDGTLEKTSDFKKIIVAFEFLNNK